MVNMCYDNFNKGSHAAKVEYLSQYLLYRKKHTLPISGVIIADFYEEVLHHPLNGLRTLIEELGFPEEYKHCMVCHNIYEKTFIDKIIVGNLATLPAELTLFEISTGLCSEGCFKDARNFNGRTRSN